MPAKPLLIALCLAAAFSVGSVRAQSPPRTAVEQARGRTGPLAKATDRAMGDHGVLLIRSKERWEEVQGLFTGLAFEKSSKDTPPFAKLDFSKSMIVAVYNLGDEQDTYSLKLANLTDPQLPQLDCAMAYTIYKSHAPTDPTYNVFCMAVPQAPAVNFTLGTYHPHNGGGKDVTPETATPEFSATLKQDLVDGLQLLSERKPKPKSTHAIGGNPPDETLSVNDDILIHLRLDLNDKADLSSGRVAKLQREQAVWFAVCSEGYRNYAFRVTTPDGKTKVCMPKEQGDWWTNPIHAIRIKADAPYELPFDTDEGSRYYSLHNLGLDTTARGQYVITALYRQSPSTPEQAKMAAEDGVTTMWAGSIASAPIVVDVKPSAETKP